MNGQPLNTKSPRKGFPSISLLLQRQALWQSWSSFACFAWEASVSVATWRKSQIDWPAALDYRNRDKNVDWGCDTRRKLNFEFKDLPIKSTICCDAEDVLILQFPDEWACYWKSFLSVFDSLTLAIFLLLYHQSSLPDKPCVFAFIFY